MKPEDFRAGRTNIGSVEFAERKKYMNYLRSAGYKLLDTHERNKLYGLVNKKYQVVMPNIPDPLPFGEETPDIFGSVFVISQFKKFKDFYKEISEISNVVPPQLISSLTPSKSYINFEEEYLTYQRIFLNILLSNVRSRSAGNSRIGFEDFCTILTDSIFVEEMKQYPVSKTGFSVSPMCDIFTTGLYVDLGQEFSPHLDEMKIQMIQDPYFECYVEYANKFGFYVDAHNPWRLVADIHSWPMQENILNSRPSPRFYDFYNNEYLFKVALSGGGSGGDYESIRSFYQRAYIEYHERYVGSQPNYPWVLPRQEARFWLDILIINKLREFGLLTQNPQSMSSSDSSEISTYEHLLEETLDRYNYYGLTSISGAEGYVMDYFSQILKERMK